MRGSEVVAERSGRGVVAVVRLSVGVAWSSGVAWASVVAWHWLAEGGVVVWGARVEVSLCAGVWRSRSVVSWLGMVG